MKRTTADGTVKLLLCHAPYDGIKPAVFLQLGPKSPQYLFNAPEGFSRLVLEHKIRPTAALKAVISLKPCALGGLAGVLMRLRDDGHGSVHLCGPAGTEAMVDALQGFVTWRHPHVTVSEICTTSSSPVYLDEHMALFSLHHGHTPALANDLLEHLQGLRQGSTQNPASSAPMTEPNCKGSCSSSSDTGSSLSDSQVTADRKGVEESASDCISSDSPNESEAFDQSKARSEHGTTAAATDLQTQATKTQQALFQNLDAILSTDSRPGMLRRKVEQVLNISASSQGAQQKAADSSSASLASPAGPANGQSACQRAEMPVALLCSLTGRELLLLLVDCPSAEDQSALSCHPAVKELAEHPVKSILCLHLTDIANSGFEGYCMWARSLPGKQVVFNPAPDSPADGLGYWAAARNLVRLHAISPALFPMPHALAWGSTGLTEEIDLPSEDSEDSEESEPSTAPASKPEEAQRLHIAAGLSQAVVRDASSITWTKQEGCHAFDPGGPRGSIALAGSPELGTAVKRLEGTALARPWYPDSSMSLHRSSAAARCNPPQQAPCSYGMPSSHHQSSHAAKRSRLTPPPRHGQPSLRQQSPPSSQAACGPKQSAAGHPIAERTEQHARRQHRMGEALQRDSGSLLFLGTGCAEPSKYRGSSGVHLRLHGGRGALIDAGEGVHGQLVRHYGQALAQEQVDRLNAVWVSHKHADHMLGLPGILKARSASQPPLLVIGPAAAGSWLASIADFIRLRYRFVHCSDFDSCPAKQWLLSNLGLRSWRCVAVEHCRDAWGLVVEHVHGWSLVYSGDTRPCKALAAAGYGCTILIHEATFEPDLLEQAIRKRHSTTDEALRVAEEMAAACTVLTHFSSRYPKLPVGLPDRGGDCRAQQVVVAFDGMLLPVALLMLAPQILPALTHAFPDT